MKAEIILSKVFLSGHPREGEINNFRHKLSNRIKSIRI